MRCKILSLSLKKLTKRNSSRLEGNHQSSRLVMSSLGFGSVTNQVVKAAGITPSIIPDSSFLIVILILHLVEKLEFFEGIVDVEGNMTRLVLLSAKFKSEKC